MQGFALMIASIGLVAGFWLGPFVTGDFHSSRDINKLSQYFGLIAEHIDAHSMIIETRSIEKDASRPRMLITYDEQTLWLERLGAGSVPARAYPPPPQTIVTIFTKRQEGLLPLYARYILIEPTI